MSIAHTVEAYLSERRVYYETRQHRASTTSVASARTAHIDEDYVAKSVVLEDEQGYVLVVLPASRRLAFDRVRDELGRSLCLSDERDVARLFPDCEVGAVPPVGAAYGLQTVLDVSLEDCDEIYFEGGDHKTLVRLEGNAFLDLLGNASVAEIAIESAGLRAALVLRERLYDALLAMGHAISGPVGSGTRWRRRMSDALARIDRALDDHIAETEGVNGILGEIVEQAPRLWRKVDGLRGEHAELLDKCHRLQAMIEGDSSELALRKRAHELTICFDEHRHHGADLVYEAFGVDLGGG